MIILYQYLGLTSDEIKTMHKLGCIYSLIQHYDKATECPKRVLALKKEQPNITDKDLAFTIGNIDTCHFAQENYDDAMQA